MDQFPDEILEDFFSHLELRELARAMCVCRRWKTIIEADRMWRKHTSSLAKKKRIVLLQSLQKQEDTLKTSDAKKEKSGKDKSSYQDFRSVLRGVYDIKDGYAEQIAIYFIGNTVYREAIIRSLKEVIFPNDEGQEAKFLAVQENDKVDVYYKGFIYQLCFDDWKRARFMARGGKRLATKRILVYLVLLKDGDSDSGLHDLIGHPSLALATKESPLILMALKTSYPSALYSITGSDEDTESEQEEYTHEKEKEKEKERETSSAGAPRKDKMGFIFVDFNLSKDDTSIAQREGEKIDAQAGGATESSPLLNSDNTAARDDDMVDVEIGAPSTPGPTHKQPVLDDASKKVFSKKALDFARASKFNSYCELVWDPQEGRIENPRELFISLLSSEENMEKEVLDEYIMGAEKARLLQRQRGNFCLPILHMTEGFLCGILMPFLLVWALLILVVLYLYTLGNATVRVLSGSLPVALRLLCLPLSLLLITMVAGLWFIIITLTIILLVLNIPTACTNGYKYGFVQASRLGIMQVWQDETSVVAPTLNWMWGCFA